MKFSNVFLTLEQRGLIVFLQSSFHHIYASFLKFIGFKYIKKTIYNYEMYLSLYDKGLSRSLILFGQRELDHKYILEKILKPKMKILDIGANIGYYALLELSLIGNNGKLIAVEPSPNNILLLKKNLAINKHNNVKIIEGGVSDKNSIKKLFLSEESNLNTFNIKGTKKNKITGNTINVETFTVSNVIQQDKDIDIIRMDVEGHEVEILNGMLEDIKNKIIRPMIIFEPHFSRYSKEHDLELPLKQLFSLGYQTKYLSSSNSFKAKDIIENKGYRAIKSVETDGVTRAIFENINNKDVIDILCKSGGARTVLLKPL